MNDQPSAMARGEDERTPSPKRKKVRAKYAPKACVSCRRSKLKCSGENPCSRCIDNGRRCFYSEDQTAAEALQHLSRPTAVQPPLPGHATTTTANANGHGHGHALPQRGILPRYEGSERRASDASLSLSVRGTSMEARMARIEGMIEVLFQERAITPRGSMERDETAIDPAFHAPMPMPMFLHEPPESRTRLSTSAASPSSSAESTSSIRVGSRSLAFPSPADYQKYIDFFFADINPCHPCINEADFRLRSERMLATRVIHATELSFLALNYIIFACSDILVDTNPPGVHGRPPGWQSFQTADELVGKRTLSGRGDVSLIQFLIWEAFYLGSADKPNAAYNVIGIACRLCFQFGLHQQSCWGNCTPFQTHMRQRIFWTVYFTDRRISLSCGRPHSIRDVDVDVDQPSWIYDRDVQSDQPLPEQDVSRSANMFLSCMIQWGKFTGDVWDRVFAAAAATHGVDGEHAVILDARIKHWTEVFLPTIPLLPTDHPPEIRHQRQHVLVHTRFNHLRLLLRRRTMMSLKYDGSTGRLCGDLAIDTVQRIKAHAPEAKHPSSFRFHMTAALGGAMLILTTLLVRDLASIGLHDKQQEYTDGFRDALSILHDLSVYLQAARRVVEDFKDIVNVVTTILNQQQFASQGQEVCANMVPTNIHDLFPYRVLDFAHQAGAGLPESNAGGVDMWNTAEMTIPNLDSWDFELQPSVTGGYGVPWI